MDFIEYFEFGANLSSGGYPNELITAIIVGCIGYAIVYTFQAITLYTIGKRNGYGHVWMAFVPFVNTYYMGVVAEKNKIFNAKPKYFSLALAILEFLLFVGFVIYYVSVYALDGMGYIVQVLNSDSFWGEYYSYELSSTVPSSMAWMGWCYDYLGTILYYVQLVYVLIEVFVLIAFFQTYAHGRYFIMALFSALFPIAGIIMFFVRKNKPMNYRDYMRMVQERRYRQYQQNQQYGNPYNYNPYNGNPNNYNPNNNPNQNNAGAANGAGGEDPFDGFGSGSSNGGGNNASGAADSDPFEDF